MLRKVLMLGSLLVIAMGCSEVREEPVGTGESPVTSRVKLRPDGKYDVECYINRISKPFTKVVTAAELSSPTLCSFPPKGWILTMTARLDGSFDISCVNPQYEAWGEVRTSAEIQANTVCEAPPAAPVGSCPGGMCDIPQGTFEMGQSGVPNRQPVHSVTVAPFRIDEFEVTRAQYAECVSQSGCTAWDVAYDYQMEEFKTPHHPVVAITWDQANQYCNWAGKRLPTEEEWEFAARGEDGRRFPWGDDPPKHICFDDSTISMACRVGAYPSDKSPFGVKDMAGNVAEFTSSLYRADYASSTDPTHHVMRGGTFYGWIPEALEATYRSMADQNTKSAAIGFRCAQ
jgi:formylglycine-generating enzyme required for sulfatase activity